MSQWNDPGKVEDALAAVVGGLTLPLYTGDGEVTAVSINTGQDDDDLGLPSVVCAVVSGGPEVVRGTGNVPARAVIRVTSSANVSLAQHRARAATVFDAFFKDDIDAILTAALSDFSVFLVTLFTPEPARKDPRDEGGFVFVSQMPIEMIWCGSDIGP